MQLACGIELVKVMRFALGLPSLRWRTITMSNDKHYRLVCKVLRIAILVSELVERVMHICGMAINYIFYRKLIHGVSQTVGQ